MTAWNDDTWVKLYRQDSADWLDWTWRGRAVFCLLLRKVDRSGRYGLGRRDDADYYVARLIDMDQDLVAEGLEELQATGTVRIVTDEGDGSRAIEIPNYTAAHPRTKTSAERMREYRARKKKSDASDGCDEVTSRYAKEREIDREIERKKDRERARTIARAREAGGQDPHLAWHQLAAEVTRLGPLKGGPRVNWSGPMPKAYPFALELFGSNTSILRALAATHRRLSRSQDHSERSWWGRRLLGSQGAVERLNSEPLESAAPEIAPKRIARAEDVLTPEIWGDGSDESDAVTQPVTQVTGVTSVRNGDEVTR